MAARKAVAEGAESNWLKYREVSHSRNAAERKGTTSRWSTPAGRLAQCCPSFEQKGEASPAWESSAWAGLETRAGIRVLFEINWWELGGGGWHWGSGWK